MPLGLLNTAVVQPQELIQGRLVHRVHLRHLHDQEVQHGPPDGHGAVFLSGGVDALAGLHRNAQLLLDLGGGLLGVRQRRDQFLVVDQIPFGRRQARQQLVLVVLQPLLVVVDLLHKFGPLLLQFRLLLANHTAQQLLLETGHCDGEVDDAALGEELWGERGVGQHGRHHHLEVVVVVVGLVVDDDHQRTPGLHDRLLQHRVQHWVDVLRAILNQQRSPIAQLIAEMVGKEAVGELGHLDAVGLLACPQPLQPLALGVHQQRVLGRTSDDDTVLYTVVVRRQPLDLPVGDLGLVHQELHHRQVLRDRDLPLDAVLVEVVGEEQRAELGVEGPAVRDEGPGQRHVPDQPPGHVLELVALVGPAVPLPGERLDQPVGGVHALLAAVGIVLQLLLRLLRRVQTALALRQVGLHLRQLLLLLPEFGVGDAQLALGLAQRLDLGGHEAGDVVVRVHGPHPRAQPGHVPAGRLGALERELGHPQVRQQQLARLAVDLVLFGAVELQQHAQEVQSGQQGLAGHLPAADEHFAAFDDLEVHAGWVEAQLEQDDDPIEDTLDQFRGLGQGLQRLHVSGGDGVQGRLGLLQSGTGGRQILLCLGLSGGHHRSLAGQHILHCRHLCLLLLGLRCGFRDLHQQNVGLLLCGHQLDLLLRQIHLHQPHVLSRLLQLQQTSVDLVRQDVNAVHLLFVDIPIQIDESQVRLGGTVHGLTEPLEVVRGGLVDDVVDVGHERVQELLRLVVGLHFVGLQELRRHVQQRLHGPREEPVDGAVRHQPRELARARPELVPDGGEAQHEMQAVADAVDEVLPQVVGRVVELLGLLLFGDGADVVEGGVTVITPEQPGHLPGGQEVVDVLQEALLLDLVVREDERDPALHGLEVLGPQVIKEIVDTVGLRDGDLESDLVDDEGGQAREGLLARAPDTDQHDVATGHAQRAGDPDDVLHGHVEQHQVQLADLVGVVELLLPGQEAAAQGLDGLDGLIDDGGRLQLLPGVGVQDGLPQEVHPVRRGLALGSQLVPEGLHSALGDGLVVPDLVLHLIELVAEHAAALGLEKVHQRLGVCDHLLAAHHHALRDTRQISDVEDVMELRGRGQHLCRDLLPETDHTGRALLGHLNDLGLVVRSQLLLDLIEAAAEDDPEDLLQRGIGGQGHVEHTEVPLQAVGDVVLASRRVRHGPRVLEVHQDLELPGFVQRVHPLHLEDLPHNLVGDLIAPFIDLGHVQVIHEEAHFHVSLGAVGRSHALLDDVLHDGLEQPRRCGGGEVALLPREQVVLGPVLEPGQELLDGHGLGRPGPAHEQHRPLLQEVALGDVQQPRGVEGRDEEGRELQLVVAGVRPGGDVVVPVGPRPGLHVHAVLEDRVLLRDVRLQRPHVHIEAVTVLLLQHPREGPGDAEPEHAGDNLLRELAAVLGEVVQDAAEQPEGVGDHVVEGRVHDDHALGLAEVPGLVHVLREQGHDPVGDLLRHPDPVVLGVPVCLAGVLHEGLQHRLPGQLGGGDVDDSGAGHGGRGGIGQGLGLEAALDAGGHGNAVPVGQGQQLVVVEHCVQVLDPNGVHRAIADDPNVLGLLFVGLAPQVGEDTVVPVPGHVHAPEHLRGRDGLGVHAELLVRPLILRERADHGLVAGALTAPGVADDHDAMAHQLGLVQLHDLGHPIGPVDDGHVLLHHPVQDGLQFVVLGLVGGQPREQIPQEGDEQLNVIEHQLGHVHVTQRSHEQEQFILHCRRTQHTSGRPQHGQNVAQPEVIVALLGQLLLAQPVAQEELEGQHFILFVPGGGQLHLLDGPSIWHHHAHPTEQHLEVLWQLLPPGVSGIHGDEEPDGWKQPCQLPVCEHELGFVLLQRRQDTRHLLSAHGEHGEVDPIELVEAAPGPGLGQTFVDLAHGPEVQLIGAVEHDHVLPEGTPQILRGLRLAGPGGACGGASQIHGQGLRQRDVASVGQGRHHQPLLDPQVLVAVLGVGVGDAGHGRVLLLLPVEPRLLLPVEAGGVAHALHSLFPHLLLMHLNRDQCLDVRALHFGQVHSGDVGQFVGDPQNTFAGLAHRLLRLGLGHGNGALHVRSPLELHAQQRDLRWKAVNQRAQDGHVVGDVHALHRHLPHNLLDGAYHCVAELVEPVLHVPECGHGGVQPHLLPLLRRHGHDLEAGGGVRGGLLLLEQDGGDTVEQGLHVGLDGLGVRCLREDLQQHTVRHEIKAGERVPLLLQIGTELALAGVELVPQVRQRGQQLVLVAVADHVLDLAGLGHDLDPLLVDHGKPLGLGRQLLHDVTPGEHGLEVHPRGLHLQPQRDVLAHLRELGHPPLDFLTEWRHESGGEHGPDLQLRLLQQLFGDVGVLSLQHDGAAVLELTKRQLAVLPVRRNGVLLVLDIGLLHTGQGDILNVLLEPQQLGVQNVLQLEEVRIQPPSAPGDLHDLLPVPVLHGGHGQQLQHGLQLQEVIDGLLQLQVRLPVPQRLGQLLALVLVPDDLFGDGGEVQLRPEEVRVAVHLLDHDDVQRVQLLQKPQLLLGLLQLRVRVLRQPEQVLPGHVRVPLALLVVVQPLVLLQPLHRLLRADPHHHGPVGVEFLAERHDFPGEPSDLGNQVPLEAALQPSDLGIPLVGHDTQLLPLEPHVADLVELVLGHCDLVLLQQLIRRLHRSELDLHLRLTPANIPQRVHQHSQVRQIVCDLGRQ
mmetsp:Transcript_20779/g.35679  ORF Transcript_20779/g.35679 Transcript_20779/m.35679 type:complete len:2651 (-) Transcript_20779:3350-11302(-)